MSAPLTPERLAEVRARVDAAWEETWRQIPGFDGYEVSDFGNVRSYYRKGNHREKRAQYPRTLKATPRRGGAYPSVSLPGGSGTYQHKAVHRLVMLAFVGPCPPGMEVAHLNGDASDARLTNLIYATHRDNESHKLAHGTRGVGERNAVAKLQGWQVAEVRYLASKSVPQGKIAALFDMDHKQVSAILNGHAWSEEPARTDVPDLLAALDAATERAEKAEDALGRVEALSWSLSPAEGPRVREAMEGKP